MADRKDTSEGSVKQNDLSYFKKLVDAVLSDELFWYKTEAVRMIMDKLRYSNIQYEDFLKTVVTKKRETPCIQMGMEFLSKDNFFRFMDPGRKRIGPQQPTHLVVARLFRYGRELNMEVAKDSLHTVDGCIGVTEKWVCWNAFHLTGINEPGKEGAAMSKPPESEEAGNSQVQCSPNDVAINTENKERQEESSSFSPSEANQCPASQATVSGQPGSESETPENLIVFDFENPPVPCDDSPVATFEDLIAQMNQVE